MHITGASIVNDSGSDELFKQAGLTSTLVSWDDSGRDKNACVGRNISDVTLGLEDGSLMPIIRKPNFTDVTCDVPLDTFKLLAGGKVIISTGTKTLQDQLFDRDLPAVRRQGRFGRGLEPQHQDRLRVGGA